MFRTLAALALTSTTFFAPPDALIEDLARSATPSTSAVTVPLAPPPSESVPVEEAPLKPLPRTDPRVEALKTYQESGRAPVIYQAQESIHPWGQSVPTLTCAPLNICTVHLEPGEEIRDIAAGDPVRWQIATATSGEPPTPHLIVKPSEHDLATNLFVSTQKRSYFIDLRSPSAAEARKPGFRLDRRLSFYYPEDFVRTLRQEEALALRSAEAVRASTLADLATDPTRLNFDYRISPRSKTPLRVFDDGQRTYLQLRGPGSSGFAPALFAIDRRKKPIALNFRPSPDGTWYIVDGVFPRLQLVARSGRADQKITIVNRTLEGR